ncbi:class III signal peptide-containing protein [Methanobrevibacter woesei]|uniref:class III signal peptide-containing protein n=1 Tax=Methanobrevibacter woesei TaxID=190976 RepID=UPI0026E0CD2C|nr:class III signal peptide-containing protein [Methanobrevibacter woesei]
MDSKAQAAAEFILIIGGIIVIVMVLLIAYKNYLNELSGEINSTEVQNLDNAINGMMEYFK